MTVMADRRRPVHEILWLTAYGRAASVDPRMPLLLPDAAGASIALARQLATGQQLAFGAMPCMCLLTAQSGQSLLPELNSLPRVHKHESQSVLDR
jgi:hypothetical protein